MKRYVRLALAIAPALTVFVLTTTLASPAGSASPPSPAAIPPLPVPIIFVAGDPGSPANWDILYMNTNGTTTNLSAQVDVISPAAGNPLFGGATIDNHPARRPTAARSSLRRTG